MANIRDKYGLRLASELSPDLIRQSLLQEPDYAQLLGVNTQLPTQSDLNQIPQVETPDRVPAEAMPAPQPQSPPMPMQSGRQGISFSGPLSVLEAIATGKDYKSRLSDPETLATIDKLANSWQQGIDQGKANLARQDELRQQIANTPTGWDATPLLAASDMWTGSNLLKSYKKPLTQEEKNLQQLKVEDMILANQLGLSKEEYQMMDAYLKNLADPVKLGMQVSKGEGTQQRFTQNEINDVLKEMRAGVKQDIIKPMSETAEQIKNVGSLVSTGKWQDVTAARSQLARLLGQKGVLTDNDVKTVIPSNIATSIAGFTNWLTNDPSADIPEPVKKQLQSLIDRAKENIKNRYIDELKAQETGFRETDVYGLMKPGRAGHNMFRSQEKEIERIFKGSDKKQLTAEDLNKQFEAFKASQGKQETK